MTPALLLLPATGASTSGGQPDKDALSRRWPDATAPGTRQPEFRGAFSPALPTGGTQTRLAGGLFEAEPRNDLTATTTSFRGLLPSAPTATDPHEPYGTAPTQRPRWGGPVEGGWLTEVQSSLLTAPASAAELEEPRTARPESVDASRTLPARQVFGAAAVALKLLVLSTTGEREEIGWLEVAQRLRRAAVVGRHRAPRHAAVALILSDALTFTPSGSVDESWRSALLEGLLALQSPFVSTDVERRLVRALLRAGWKVIPPVDEGILKLIAGKKN